MSNHATYSYARDNLASLWDQAISEREAIVISRRGHAPVALIALDELESLETTAHLLRSPANAGRLLTALGRALQEEGNGQSLQELASEVGLELEQEA